MRTPTTCFARLTAAAVAISLLAAACQPQEDSLLNDTPSSTEQASTEQSPTATTGSATQESAVATSDPASRTAPANLSRLDPSLQTMLTNLGGGYEAIDGVWEGFVPNDHPVVIAIKKPDSTTAIALNHPNPEALGDAEAIPTGGLPFTSIHHVENPADLDALNELESFDFHAKLGGVDSFAMVATKAGDGFFDPETKDYVATLLHELFHRYQDQSFKGGIGSQDVEGYAYDAANLELAVLEERALSQALEATTDENRDTAARRFAALRLARLDADDRVVLDSSQERFEGTARYIEHRLSGEGTEYNYHDGNYQAELITNFGAQGTKDSFGFGRFYASGAAVLAILDRMETENVAGRIEAGEDPAEILIAELGVDPSDVEPLVDEAKSNYDPLKELAAAASEAAESAVDEPPVFDESNVPSAPSGSRPEGEGAGEGKGQEITDAELDCLAAEGLDIETDTEITDAQFEACLT